jgi:dolichol-phosphate mannosyltransferase
VTASAAEALRANWEVPAFRVEEFSPRRNRYCLCIFVLNEDGRIQPQLAQIRGVSHSFDIIVADGGSTDGSVASHVMAPLGVRALLIKQGPGKLSAQMRMALAYAMTEGYEAVVVMDGNNKDGPEALPRFAAALDAGYDHVQGSRFLPGGAAINTPLLRWAGLRFLHAPLISIAARRRYTDTTNGFRAYSRRLLLDPAVAPFRSVFATYELHYYLAIRAARLGYRVTEIPVRREYPSHGPVPTKISPIAGSLHVLSVLFRACRHRFNPSTPSAPHRSE